MTTEKEPIVCDSCGCWHGHHLYNCGLLLQPLEQINTLNSINWFFGEYKFLSNFEPSEVAFDGVTYPTVEHGYVAAKTLDDSVRIEVLACDTPGKVKRFGSKLLLREDWEAVKLDVMDGLLRQKFDQSRLLAIKLKATSGKQLVESNYWHDLWWGKCVCIKHKGEGKNHLGKLLMNIRDDILPDINSLIRLQEFNTSGLT